MKEKFFSLLLVPVFKFLLRSVMFVMKLIKVCGFVLLSVLAPWAMSAGKVAVFNPQVAFTSSESAKAAYEELKRNPTFAKLIADADGIDKELQELDKERKSKGLTWSAEQTADNQKKIEYLLLDRRGLEKKVEAENKAYLTRMMEIGQKSAPQIIERIIKAEGIDIVLRPDAVFIVAPELDITPKVVEELNKIK